MKLVAAACQSAKDNPGGMDLLGGDRTKATPDGRLITKNKPIGMVRLIVDAGLWLQLESAIEHLVQPKTKESRQLPDSKLEINFHPC